MAQVFYNDLPRLSIRYNNDLNEMQTYSLSALRAFMYYVLDREKLTIAEYLDKMGHDPYFLLAATGLGKTVAAPIHSYLRHCENILRNVKPGPPLYGKKSPRLIVVEPKISIASSQTEFMNSMFSDFIKMGKNNPNVTHPTMFGCKTSVHSINRNSPVQFVTTGIFAIYARLGWLDPLNDCVIIDESHVTIDSAEGEELAIAICRKQGVPIHYMSATVDTANLHETLGVRSIVQADKQRFPIWMHNTGRSMEESIVDMIEKTLVRPDPRSEYFPKGNDSTTKGILNAVLQNDRAKGFLVIINSFAGEDSDANKIAELLHSAPYAKEIEVLLLASAVIRNPAEKRKFDAVMEKIERERKKYIIIATSVVEMGVTFPTLDFVATMDLGYESISVGDYALSEVTSLPVNSLKQRIGRVGRKRPGIGYISNEVGADYALLSDSALNGGLRCEPIGLPLRKGSLTIVAQYSFKEEWENPVEDLKKLNLPSGIHNDPDRVNEFLRQRQRLIDLGVAVDNQLTEEGKFCERWLDAGVDLGYAIKLQDALADENMEDLLYYLVATALSNVGMSTLMDRDAGATIEEFSPQGGDTRHRRGVRLNESELELTPQSELIALYNIVAYFSNKYANAFAGNGMSDFVRDVYREALIKDCAVCGYDPKNIEELLKGFKSILKTFMDSNARRKDYAPFNNLFGEAKQLRLTDMTFPVLSEWQIKRYMQEVANLPGRIKITITQGRGGFDWKEIDGKRTGTLYTNGTCLDLTSGQTLTVKLVPLPGKGDRKAGEAWRIVHAQHDLKTGC